MSYIFIDCRMRINSHHAVALVEGKHDLFLHYCACEVLVCGVWCTHGNSKDWKTQDFFFSLHPLPSEVDIIDLSLRHTELKKKPYKGKTHGQEKDKYNGMSWDWQYFYGANAKAIASLILSDAIQRRSGHLETFVSFPLKLKLEHLSLSLVGVNSPVDKSFLFWAVAEQTAQATLANLWHKTAQGTFGPERRGLLVRELFKIL